MTRLHATLLIVPLLASCSSDSATGANDKSDKTGQKNNEGGDGQATNVSGPAKMADGTRLGQLRSAEHIDLTLLVNKTPAEVDAVLGTPTQTGSDRISCVRFVPQRVFFACTQEIRVYERAPFEEVRIDFEDGRAAQIGLSGLPGEGPFDVDDALHSIGLSLPEAPSHDNPGPGIGGEPSDVVDRWEWSNDRARLRIDGLEHRVRVTAVNSDWRRAKIEIINNNPLDPGQEARIKPVKGETASAVSEPTN